MTSPSLAGDPIPVVVDSSIIIDGLRSPRSYAANLLREVTVQGRVFASEITRVEVGRGIRPGEELATITLFASLTWHPVDTAVAERAAALGREWAPSHSGIDAADLVIAATTEVLGARLITRNVRHFPMFPDLVAPY